MRHFALLKDFFWKNKWRYIIGIGWLILVDALQLVTPKVIGRLTDEFTAGTVTYSKILAYVGVILGLAVFISICRYFWRIYVMGTARLAEYHLRGLLFGHLEKLSADYFNNHKTGDLMAHATNDIGAVRAALGPGIVMLTDAIFLTIVTMVIMFVTIDVKLTALALVPLPFIAIVSTTFGRSINNRFKAVQDAFAKLTDRVQENLSGIRVVKAFVQEKAEIDKFMKSSDKVVETNMNLVKVWGLFFPLMDFIASLSFLVVLGYGGILVIRGSISLGDFIAFNSYLGTLLWPMHAIGWVINMMQRGFASMERIAVILRTEPEIFDGPSVKDIRHIRGEIEFRGLTFAYPGHSEPVLKDIDLSIESGKTLAVVGRTGSGKSTLVNLLVRLYNPPRGQVFIDGVDVNDIPLSTLRENTGYVPQDTFLFSKTIAENIAFAPRTFSKDEIVEAAETAQVHGNIVEFPQGYDTILGERGVTLSGGQKQRVAIARAVIKNPAILILDDCLSAVDTHTEEEILKRLKRVMENRTSIVIAHRISTIKDADEIVVLDGGRIAERGTHESLLAQRGIYWDMYQRQLLEEEIAQKA